jgi:hypothetical protein
VATRPSGRCQEGLKAPPHQPKRRRLWLNDGSCVRPRLGMMDSVTAITLRFQVLYALLVFSHARHELRHFAVTAHPTTER